MRYYYIRKKEEDETIAIKYLPTEQIITNGFTKSLPMTQQRSFIESLGLE